VVHAAISPSADYRYQLLKPLSNHQFRALVEDIRERGVLVPIEIDEIGQILDGHHRWQACQQLGITDFPIVVRSGMTELQKRTHARSLNAVRRQLNRLEKRELIEQELFDNPSSSNNSIAKRLGVSDVTVANVRKQLGLDALERVGEDGKIYEYRPPDEFAEPEEEYTHVCPSCNYRWSGNSK
jgi:ParB/RepB/Spo0J family partition protein